MGVLTTAVTEGRWIVIEDIDLASHEVLAVLGPLLETRELFIGGRGEVVRAAEGFRIFATRTINSNTLSTTTTLTSSTLTSTTTHTSTNTGMLI